LGVAIARFEDVPLGVVGSVVGASDTVKDVFTVVSGVGTGWITGLQAESVGTDEAGGLDSKNHIFYNKNPVRCRRTCAILWLE